MWDISGYRARDLLWQKKFCFFVVFSSSDRAGIWHILRRSHRILSFHRIVDIHFSIDELTIKTKILRESFVCKLKKHDAFFVYTIVWWTNSKFQWNEAQTRSEKERKEEKKKTIKIPSKHDQIAASKRMLNDVTN